jgi:hypothetical protein
VFIDGYRCESDEDEATIESDREGSVCRYRNLSPRRGTTQEDGIDVVPSYEECSRCCQFDLV